MQTLSVETLDSIRSETQSDTLKAEISSDLQNHAEQIVENLFGIDARELHQQHQLSASIQALGAPIQQRIHRQSTMLKQPMAKLIEDAEDGGSVANSLLNLQQVTEEINPNRVDFSIGSLRRLISWIPGVGTPISRWTARFQSIDNRIQGIVENLEEGKAQLQRDNTTLTEDQIAMQELIFKLEDHVSLGTLMDQKITARLEAMSQDDSRRTFLEEEILFLLRQRVIDLQQQLVVNQQGVLAIEVVIRNNEELIRGVSRSINVTTTALNVASTLVLALHRQEYVLKGLSSVKKSTGDLLAGTVKQLRKQGGNNQNRVASASYELNNFKAAFADVKGAVDEINYFRQSALPQMANSINEMNHLNQSADKSIQKLEQRVRVQEGLVIQC